MGRKHVALGGATLVASLAVALFAGVAGAVDQEPKNGCSSPVPYSGSLTSPTFTGPPAPGVEEPLPSVRFQGWFDGESVNAGGFDRASVRYSIGGGEPIEFGALIDAPGQPPNDGGSPDVEYSNRGTGQGPEFDLYVFPLPEETYGQPNVRIHFHFDTLDSAFNGFRGFGVDNVSVDGSNPSVSEGFESPPPQGWEFEAPSTAGPNVPFWHVVANPEDTLIKSPEINPDLITLSAGDNGSLPPAPPVIEGSNFRYAWFGDDPTGTYCGPDYANRFQEPTPEQPAPITAAQVPQPPRTVDDLPAPGFASSVNVQELSGDVRVGVLAAAAGGARASQKGVTFVPLSEARQIPVGSFLDTRRGAVRLQSARDRRGTRQNGDFSTGLFQVLQSRRARGLTDVVLKGASFSRCRRGRRGKGASTSQSRIIRRLRSNARGRFRTRGRHSAATVRGTAWLTADRCDGTLTKVSRGKVAVRDFRRRKTVVVRAGKSYLARAKR